MENVGEKKWSGYLHWVSLKKNMRKRKYHFIPYFYIFSNVHAIDSSFIIIFPYSNLSLNQFQLNN